MAMTDKEKRKYAEQWVADGKPCTYKYGLGYRGARPHAITSEKAKELIRNTAWQFGMGFYSLDFEFFNGTMVLEFNELHENDLY